MLSSTLMVVSGNQSDLITFIRQFYYFDLKLFCHCTYYYFFMYNIFKKIKFAVPNFGVNYLSVVKREFLNSKYKTIFSITYLPVELV